MGPFRHVARHVADSWALLCGGSVCVVLCGFHTSRTAQLLFPRNMYVLNRYANYSNGTQEA